MADNIKQNQPELDLGEQQRIRQEKLKALQEEGTVRAKAGRQA